MKKLTFLGIFVFFVLTINAQALKTYNGEMIGEIGVGNAIYTYLLDSNGAEVKHGAYKFTEIYNPSDAGSYSGILTGNFKNGLKDGTWTYSVNLLDYPATGDVYTTGTISVRMIYSNGLPNGAWSYSRNGKYRKRLYSLSGWRCGSYETQSPEIIQLNWEIGVITGNLVMKNHFYNVTGQLDNNGFWIGKWIVDKEQSELILSEGVLKAGMLRNFMNQSTPIKYDEELLLLQEQYKSLSNDERKSFAMEHHLKIDTIQGLKYYNINDGYFNKKVFNCGQSDDKYILTDKINYGKFVTIDRIEIVPLNELVRQYSLNPNFRTPKELEEFLETHKLKLTRSDIKEFEEIIKNRKAKLEEDKENKEYVKRYKNLHSQLLELTKTFDTKCPKLDMFNIKEVKAIDDITKKLYISVKTKYFTNKYKTTDFSSYGYNPDYKPTGSSRDKFIPIVSEKESYTKLNEYVDFIKTKQSGKDSINTLACLPEEIKINAYSVERAYVTNLSDIDMSGEWTRYNPKKVKKSKLYNPYFETIQYMGNTINRNGTFAEIYNSINDINNLCLFMLDNIKGKTGDLEKELSSTDIVNEWLQIFRKYMDK